MAPKTASARHAAASMDIRPATSRLLSFCVKCCQEISKDPQELFYVLLWGLAAEALVHTWVPLSLNRVLPVYPGIDFTGLVLNLLGAAVTGASAALLDAPGTRASTSVSRVAIGMRDGFVAVLTSFPGWIEQLFACTCSQSFIVVFVSGSFCGPIFHIFFRKLGLLLIRFCRVSARGNNSDHNMPRIIALFLVISLAVEVASNATGIHLLLGWAFVTLACVFGIVVDVASREATKEHESADQGVLVSNFVSVCLLCVVGPFSGYGAIGNKFRGSFCGAVSSYGGFAQKVGEYSLAKNNTQKRKAVRTWWLHVRVALIGIAALYSQHYLGKLRRS